MTSSTPIPFATAFYTRARLRGPFCLGIDPSPEVLANMDLPDTLQGLRQFCDIVLDHLQTQVALVKAQSAYFERFGPAGWKVLRDLIADTHAQDTLLLLDAKRGDIGSTNVAYAEAYLHPEGPYDCDALTLSPYLGVRALSPFFEAAVRYGKGVFVVARSSDPAGRTLQEAGVAGGQTVAGSIVQALSAWNQTACPKPPPEGYPVGIVMGATCTDLEIAPLLPLTHTLCLCPGLGVQGGSWETLLRWKNTYGCYLIPTVSRSVYAAGPAALGTSIRDYCAQ